MPVGSLTVTIASTTPEALEWLDDGSTVGVTWQDGHRSTYSLDYLRKICPCAACLKIHDSPPIRAKPKKLFPVLTDQQAKTALSDASVKSVAPVGNYALQFNWADGHDDGLYSYQYLRKMCACSACRPTKPVDASD